MLFVIRYRNKSGRAQLGFVHAPNEQAAIKQAIKLYGLFIISVKCGHR